MILNSIYSSLNYDNLCKYHDLISYKSAIPLNCKDYLNILTVNIRSLNKNYDHLISLLKTLHKLPDILCITETWLKPSNVHLFNIEDFNSFHTYRPEGSIGGGVSIYVNNNIPSVLLKDHQRCDENIEICTVKISIDKTPYIIASLYRPHSKHSNVNEFNTIMDNLLSQNIFINSRTVITDDFNINLLEHEQHLPTNNFLVTMQSFNYFPHISKPTRFPNDIITDAPSILDHF